MADNRGPQLTAAISSFLAFSWTFVLLRCYTRIMLVKLMGVDDYLCVLAQFLFTGYAAFSAAAVPYGFGEHLEDIDPVNIPIALKWLWVSDPFYALANMALKVSIGLFLLNICVAKVQRVIIWAVIASSVVTCLFFTLIVIFQCQPISYFWEQAAGKEGTCLPPHVLMASTYAYTAWSCWSDWTYCILPCFVVWKLQMNRPTKISVCVILSVSSLASILTVVRIPSIGILSDGHDFLYNCTTLTIWSVCETGLAIMACSAVTLRPLVRKISSKFSTKVSSEISMRGRTEGTSGPWPPYARYTRTDGTVDKDGMGIQTTADKNGMGIQTTAGTHAGGNKGINHMSRWPEDDRSSILEVDAVSNLSQTKLTTDLENGLAVENYPSNIKKTVTVTMHSTRAP